ncbi:alpha/beta fold hydrolase, partial [Planktotalea sp.]|uniref:alpha/beta fold hydrolase n=1 Tax=Planktotalea sp. TaxID=2029877 RepID=UPI00329817E1
MDVIKINDAHIAYRHRASLGRTIVFANSLGSDQSIWDDVIAHLPKGYGILTYDLRGHGQSSGVAESIEGLAEDASHLIDALGITDVLFCGVSIGGMIGQVLAAKRADVICAAALCNTAPKIGTAERWAERIALVEEGGVESCAAMIVNNWFGPDYAACTDRMALHQTMVGRTSNAGYAAACRAIRDADLSAFAKAIEVPCLCIGGQHDKSVLPAAVQALAETIPNAKAQIFESLGHLPCLEMPEQLAALIAGFDPIPSDRTQAGMQIRRAVLSDSHVDKASAKITTLDQAFQSLITEGAWGTVWANPGISARERSMLTLALLAATGNFEEIPMHIRATARTGASERDITE